MYQRMLYYIPEMPGFMPLIKADELVCMYKSDTAFQKGGGGGGALMGSFKVSGSWREFYIKQRYIFSKKQRRAHPVSPPPF